MNATEADLAFPLIGFVHDGEIVGFSDIGNLTICHSATLDRGRHVGLELLDGKLDHWIVRSLRVQPPAVKPVFWKRLFVGRSDARFELELEKLDSLSIEQVQSSHLCRTDRGASRFLC